MKNKKYITINEDGCDFRTMAEIMSELGYQMNHATARNILLTAVQSFISIMSQSLDSPVSKKDIQKMLKSQNVHEHLSDVLYRAYEELKKEGEV